MRTPGRGTIAIASLSALLLSCRHAVEPPEAPQQVKATLAVVGRADLTEDLALRGRLVPPADEDATISAQVPANASMIGSTPCSSRCSSTNRTLSDVGGRAPRRKKSRPGAG